MPNPQKASKSSKSTGQKETKTSLPVQNSSTYVSPYAPLPDQPQQSASASVTSGKSVTPQPSSSSKMSSLSAADKAKLIKSLETHSVNTLIELRRIEKTLAGTGSASVTALTNAWAHYVNSNNLLSELRGLTKSYPFSSECLDEAKWMVISDPQSTRSWNYCWLVLQKIKNQNLIPKHARQLAAKPSMWGGKTPSAQQIEQLATACTNEWTRAMNQMLRHWEAPPTLSGK